MVLIELEKEINKLKLSEKLRLIEDVWDSILIDNVKLPIPDWQKKELDVRYREYIEGNLTLHDWKNIYHDLKS